MAAILLLEGPQGAATAGVADASSPSSTIDRARPGADGRPGNGGISVDEKARPLGR